MSFEHRSGSSVVKGDFSALDHLISELGKGYYVDVGILGESNETEEGGITTAGIGAVHEFGTDDGRIPERSWLREPIETGQESIEAAIQRKIKPLIESGDISGIMKIIGIAAEARIQEAFETGGFGNWPDITEETKDRKGSDAILIDDGAFRKSITSKPGGA